MYLCKILSAPYLAAVFAAVLFSSDTSAQSADAAENKRMIEEKNFVFVAQQVNPQRGISRPLTPDYDLTVNSDSVIAVLPYFGRAFTAPMNPAEGGIRFTSTDFEYQSTGKKKKGYSITIKPNDASGIQALRLTLFDNGRGTLQVTQLNKEPISFTGYIRAGRDRPKKAF